MLQPDDRVLTLYAYNGDVSGSLTFAKNDSLIVVEILSDSNWIRGRNGSGMVGFVPVNYLKKVADKTAPWYHGEINRTDTEHLLSRKAEGNFLIRASIRYHGDFTLSVVFNNGIEHYRIMFQNGSFTIDEEVTFPALELLVKHYSKDADGLCCRLTTPLPNDHQARIDQLQIGGWMLDSSLIKFEDKLGGGEFGDVMKANFNGTEVAVKCIKKDKKATEIQFLTYEASLMTSLKHPNLVAFIGLSVNERQKQVYLVMEFMENGALINYLRTRGKFVVTKKDQIRFAIDTCRGMVYLEQERLIHRDLAARNVLLAGDLTAKVADFGLAGTSDQLMLEQQSQPLPQQSQNSIEGTVVMAGHQGTDQLGNKLPVKWTAPEAVKFNIFSNKSDVWSFGILLWEIYSYGRMPYPKLLANQVISSLEQGKRMDAPDSCPSNISQIMRNCWQMEPQTRPTFEQLLKLLEHDRCD